MQNTTPRSKRVNACVKRVEVSCLYDPVHPVSHKGVGPKIRTPENIEIICFPNKDRRLRTCEIWATIRRGTEDKIMKYCSRGRKCALPNSSTVLSCAAHFKVAVLYNNRFLFFSKASVSARHVRVTSVKDSSPYALCRRFVSAAPHPLPPKFLLCFYPTTPSPHRNKGTFAVSSRCLAGKLPNIFARCCFR